MELDFYLEGLVGRFVFSFIGYIYKRVYVCFGVCNVSFVMWVGCLFSNWFVWLVFIFNVKFVIEVFYDWFCGVYRYSRKFWFKFINVDN